MRQDILRLVHPAAVFIRLDALLHFGDQGPDPLVVVSAETAGIDASNGFVWTKQAAAAAIFRVAAFKRHDFAGNVGSGVVSVKSNDLSGDVAG